MYIYIYVYIYIFKNTNSLVISFNVTFGDVLPALLIDSMRPRKG